MDGLCCSTPWTSKGFPDAAARVQRDLATAVSRALDGRDLDVIVDATSCTHTVEAVGEASGFRTVDAVAYTRARILPLLEPVPADRMLDTLVLHPTCSGEHLGMRDALIEVGRSIAREVVVPDAWGCCGMAGDRGLLHPELTAGATRAEATEVRGLAMGDGRIAYASSNRTCELGMTRATGRSYRHLLELVAQAHDLGAGRTS